MEPNETHPDPLTQGMSAAGQKVAEAAAIAALVAQLAAQIRARRAAQETTETAADEAGHATAQTLWAPALHPEWLADAGLLDTARAWSAAAAWEHADPSASAAADAAERRLRDLHPYAMRRYDELRGQGVSRAGAMMDTVPLFAMHPNPRPAPWDVWQGRYLASAPGTDGQPPVMPGMDTGAAVRVLGILARLNAESVSRGDGPLTTDVAATELRRRANAPGPLIDQVIAGLRDGRLPIPEHPPARPARRTVSATGPGAADWPAPATGAVAGRGNTGTTASAPAAARTVSATGPGTADWPAPATDAVAAAAGRVRRAARPVHRRAPGQRPPHLHP